MPPVGWNSNLRHGGGRFLHGDGEGFRRLFPQEGDRFPDVFEIAFVIQADESPGDLSLDFQQTDVKFLFLIGAVR